MKILSTKRVLFGLFIIAIIGLLIYGMRPQPLFVSTFTVVKEPLSVLIEEEGKTRIIDRYVISAPIDGYIQRIKVHVGDTVKKDQILVWIKPLPSGLLDPRSRSIAQARVSSARAALELARENTLASKADAELAQTELKRAEKLYSTKVIQRGAYDIAQANQLRTKALYRSVRFAVEVARFELKAAQMNLDFSQDLQNESAPLKKMAIKSPVDGQILKVIQRSEGSLRTGQAIVEVGNPQAIEVSTEVLSRDTVRIKPGLPVRFEHWGGTPLKGLVRTVEPTGFTKISALGVEEQRVKVIADITSPTDQWLRLGDAYAVTSKFILWQAEQVLQIPANALFRVGTDWSVFVVLNGEAKRQKVKVGQRGGIRVEILGGLEAGDIVITHPDKNIGDGSRVTIEL